MTSTIAVPGERLGSLDDFEPGQGTYTRGGFIYSKLAGRKRTSEGDVKKKGMISVELEEATHFVPEIGMNKGIRSRIPRGRLIKWKEKLLTKM